MIWFIFLVATLIAAIFIFFKAPFSVIKKEFQNDIQHYSNKHSEKNELITQPNISQLPLPVQNFLKIAGYLGKPKMSSMKAYIFCAPLKDSNDKPAMIVDYTLCSFANEPVRLAYIQTSLYGIPFEAYDSTQEGRGSMKGVIGKVFTLFNQTGTEMDKAQLLTYLGECFLIPSSIFSEFISWESIDSNHVKATINYQGISGSGTFTFDDKGFVQSFQTNERAKIATDGSVEYPKWSLIYGEFIKKNDLYLPTKLQTIWHEAQADLVYFHANDIQYEYDS